MTSSQKFIEGAIAGGWAFRMTRTTNWGYTWDTTFSRIEEDDNFPTVTAKLYALPEAIHGRYFEYVKVSVHEILLDPLAWQSYGKHAGWEALAYKQSMPARKHRGGTVAAHIRMMHKPTPNRWLKEWHRFIDLLAEGKAQEEALTEILK